VRILRSLYTGALLSVLVGVLASALGLAQTQQPSQGSEPAQQQDQDVVYTADEYAAYQKATEEPDPAKREDAIIAFVKANPKSSLVQYAVGAYMQLLQDYTAKGEMAKVAAAGEKLLSVKPGDLSVMYSTGAAFFKTQQFAKAAGYLEQVYQKQPEPAIAYMLAVAYGSPEAKDEAKVAKYGEIACATFEPKDCYVILTEMTRAASEQKQWDKAADYATKTLAAFDVISKPAAVSDADWTEYVNREKAVAYAVLGRQAFEQGKWQGVLDNYEKALKQCDKLPALNAEAYYYIGLTHWKLERLDPAMKAFARGSVQKDTPFATENLKQLTTLYKSQHNDSTAGMDEYIQEATQNH